MRTLRLLSMLGCFVIGGMPAATFACNATYDPATARVWVPCVDIAGDQRSVGAVLQSAGPNTFVVTAVEEFVVTRPKATSLRIILSPPHVVALISGPDPGCASTLQRPRVTQVGGTVDIEVKARLMLNPIVLCPAIVSSFVDAVVLPIAGDPRTQTYSVNGFPITPTF
jgi:hypothetical protein